jgi:membrane protein implicated in regulation of membrane protease activity
MANAEHFIPWIWIVAGLLLCAAETFAPGIFLLWIGLAGMAVGVVHFLVPLGFEWSLVLFAVLALAFSLIGRKVYGSIDTGTAGDALNRRADVLVGRDFPLERAIVNGAGAIRVYDTVWRVTGPDLPQGARVRVSGVEDGVLLRVEPAASG